MHTRIVLALAFAYAVAGCGSDNNGTNAPSPPSLASVAVAANPNNVLSVIVTANVTSADSARVSYWTGSEAPRVTPYSSSAGSDGRLVVLGLRPSTSYSFAIEAANRSATVTSDTVTLTTAALPAFLAGASLAGSSPTSGGYILTALTDGSNAYVVAFDSTGQVAWYRTFTDGKPAEEIKQQQNGDITVVLTTSHGGEQVEGEAVAIASDGSIVRTITAPPSSYLDGHEFWETFTDKGEYNGAVFFAYTARHVDLSAHGGPADSLITGHQIVQQDASGNQHVLFDAWNHFQITDNVEASAGQLDFDHPNALAFASDGNYVVSWRNLDILTKINSSTGDLMWTLASPFAARASDFTITGDPLGGFSAQHSLRVLDNGDLLLFDNGTRHVPSASRAVEYALDTTAHTAAMVWQYHHTPAYYTAFTGSVQRLENGNTLIGWTFGSPIVATEVTSSGGTAWEGTLTVSGNQTPYRFTKIVSLYKYIRP